LRKTKLPHRAEKEGEQEKEGINTGGKFEAKKRRAGRHQVFSETYRSQGERRELKGSQSQSVHGAHL